MVYVMGANTHLTVQPDTVDMNTKTRRLANDLGKLDAVTDIRESLWADNALTFACEGSMPGDIPNAVLRVLADHNAMLPDQQPDERRRHNVLIELE